jgi:hypothetical protein
MPADATVPPGIVTRAATIARGPHPCPSCECPTWTQPPVPWTDLRDYVVRCEACERPLAVRIDRSRILRRGAVPAHLRAASRRGDAAAALLVSRGTRGFLLRLMAALPLPLVLGLVAWGGGAAIPVVLAFTAAGILPAALWGPALVATWLESIRRGVEQVVDRARRSIHVRPRPAGTVEVLTGRWDQWLREQRLRDRERAEHPDAVLRELGRVLDGRELRRVRGLAERGEVPVEHLEDLLRFRRSWPASTDRRHSRVAG